MPRAPLSTHWLSYSMTGADAKNSRANGRYNLETLPKGLVRTAQQARQFSNSQTKTVCRPHRPGTSRTKNMGFPWCGSPETTGGAMRPWPRMSSCQEGRVEWCVRLHDRLWRLAW